MITSEDSEGQVEEKMAPDQNKQLENIVDALLKSEDVRLLQLFLQHDVHEGTIIKCSQQFLTKLDKLVCRGLDQKDPKLASLGFAILHKCGKNLRLPRHGQGVLGLMAQDLLEKWFEKCRQLWIQCGPQWNETLFNLSEDFFDALMVVHDSCKEGKYKVTESFLYPVGQLAVDPRVYILIQKEAIRKYNLILDKIPVELKKERKILASQEASDIMTKMAGQIMDSGDYDLQIALMEALCRMASPGQRRDLADQWFSMEHVASAFVKIRDSEFETDCRKFFNLVNGMQGDRRRVYSYPCLEVYLDKYELLMPSDEKLDEFWIDFNLGSSSISFYFTLAGEQTQEGQWETLCINENEVDSYTVKEQGKRSILYVKLTEVVAVGPAEGSSLTIHFSSSLDILQAARSVYGCSKNKGFVGKTGTSEVETMVKIVMEEYSSQVVPESQLSLDNDKNTAPYLQPASSAPVQTVTPARMKISEATSFINSSAGGGLHGASFVLAVPPSTKVKGKQPLELVRSCGMVEEVCQGKNKPVLNTVDMNLAGQGEELENGFVPDTQPRNERNISSNLSKLSVSEMIMMPTQKFSVLPRPELCSSQSGKQQRLSSSQIDPVVGPTNPKQLHAEVTKRLQQVLKERKQEPTDNSKSRGSADRYASTVSATKGQQARQKDLTKPKGKGQAADSAVITPPTKASTTKAVEKTKEPSISADAKKTLSSKEKSDAELAGSMVKQISSRYDFTAKATVEKVCGNWNPFATRSIFNKSWFSTVKREASGGLSLIKADSKTATRVAKKSQDVFDYHTDAPFSIGGKDKTLSSTSALSSSGLHDSSVPLSTTKKGQPVAKEQRHVKKHLFSDTDTDYVTTDVSWLRESSRKPKPKVTKYPRQAPIKPTSVSPHTSYESPNSPLSSQKPAKSNTRPNKKKPDVKEKVEQPKKTAKPAAGTTRPHAAGRRPQRAAATLAKSYKEPDTDDSLSETEKPLISKHTSSDHPDHAERTHKTAKVTKKQAPNNQQTKSYKELENKHHGSQSESIPEQPRATKKTFVGQQREIEKICSVAPQVKKTKSTSEHSADSYRRLNGNNQSGLKKPSSVKQQMLVNAGPETSKLKKRSVSPAQEQMNTLKGSWATRQTSFCQSPPFIERMRSAERSDPTLGLTCSPLSPLRESPLPASPDPSCQDTPSPILLLPKACSTASSKGSFRPSSLYSAEKQRRSSKTHSIQSLTCRPSLAPIDQNLAGLSAEMSPVQGRPTASPPSPLCTLPLLSSTVVEQEKLSMPSPPQLPFVEDQYSLSKVSRASLNSQHSSSAESSGLNNRVKDSPAAVLGVSTEKSPPSNQKSKPSPLLVSGPSRKRYFSSSSLEEEEKEEKKASKIRGRPSPRLKPRKLFKSFAEVSAVSDRCLEMSSSHTVSSSHWEDEVGDMDVDDELELSINAANASSFCQQLSSELKKKFQSRCKMMEVYNKQSLTAVQQHVSSLNMQVSKQRTQKLEQLQEVLLEQIHTLEQSHTVLKSMEKDMMMFWKKQSVAFQSYHKQETKRNEILGKVLQNNVYHSVEYEEKLFTSQMCLIRKDMKLVQDGLLSQMQEVEIQSVKKGLHALFFP